MKQWRGWSFPDGEEHLIDWMQKVNRVEYGRPSYQFNKYRVAADLCRRRRTAVDVGANVGLWSWPMSYEFARVIAFEPVRDYATCWRANMIDRNNAELIEMALGDETAFVTMACFTPGSHGDTRVRAPGDNGRVVDRAVPLGRIDDGFPNMVDVDLVKVDCEGYELYVLKGAEQMLRRERPVVIVEQKPGKAAAYGLRDTEAVNFLLGLGMSLHSELAGDYILTW